MSKIEKIIYKCDVCEKEFENPKDVAMTSIPCYGGERGEYLTDAAVDLCIKCSKNIRKVIYNNFAEISDWYGVHIRNKQKE